jgi:hypothetical protein
MQVESPLLMVVISVQMLLEASIQEVEGQELVMHLGVKQDILVATVVLV